MPEAGQLPPGSAIQKGPFVEDKKPWTWDDIATTEHVLWTPTTVGPLTWNGLTLYVAATADSFQYGHNVVVGQEARTPKCFKDVHDESLTFSAGHRHRIEYALAMRDDPGPGQSPSDELVRELIQDAKAHFTIEEFSRDGWDADPYLVSLDRGGFLVQRSETLEYLRTLSSNLREQAKRVDEIYKRLEQL